MRKTACWENLYLKSLDSELFLNHVTGDETYLHHYEPETKQRVSQMWLPTGSQAPIKAIRHLSNKKVMCAVFWDRAGVLLVIFFRKGTTMTGQICAKI
jgi:hypothetical protein